jgi:N-acyl-D-aspartate/D-glutamate deacylase
MGLLIQGGTVIDGTGAPGFRADVRVADGRIVEIGPQLQPQGEDVLDARSAYVTPGFIDTHTHFDASLYWDPACDPMLQHGVTTVLIGNCGLGLAPLRAGDRDALAGLFAYVEDLPLDVMKARVPWTWETFGDYARDLAGRDFGPNVAALVSHSLLRMWVMGDEAWHRAATAPECERMAALLGDAMKAGASGLSSSLYDRTADGMMVPSAYADDAEFSAMFEVLAQHGGLFQIIPRLWSPDLAIGDLERLAQLAMPHGVPVLSNGIFERPEDHAVHERMVASARKLNAAGARLYHLASPRSIELPIRVRDCFSLGTVPAWAQLVNAQDDKTALLSDPEWRARARDDWAAASFSKLGHLTRIVKVGNPELSGWVGRTLADLVAERGGDASDVMADWFVENQLDAEFVIPISNLDHGIVGQLLAAPENLISGSDAGAHYQMFSGAGDSTLVLTRHVRERGDLTLELAVRKLTADQADLLGMTDRGRIAEGCVADIAVFSLDELHWAAENVVHDVPGGNPRFTRAPGGYRYTLVNGIVVQEAGKATGILPGRFADELVYAE